MIINAYYCYNRVGVRVIINAYYCYNRVGIRVIINAYYCYNRVGIRVIINAYYCYNRVGLECILFTGCYCYFRKWRESCCLARSKGSHLAAVLVPHTFLLRSTPPEHLDEALAEVGVVGEQGPEADDRGTSKCYIYLCMCHPQGDTDELLEEKK